MAQLTVTIDEAMRIAIEHHQAGRLAAAEEIARQVLAQRPNHAHALHLLGVLAFLKGQASVAIDLVGRAIASNPAMAEYHSNLGEFKRRMGQIDEAIASFQRAVELDPGHAEAHGNLGIALHQKNRLDEAIGAYRRGLALKPGLAGGENNLGVALRDRGLYDEAVAAYRRALARTPDMADVYNNLGIVLRDQNRYDEAIAAYRRAIELKPDMVEAHNNLGIVLKNQGRPDEAIALFRRAIELKPGYADAYNNLGNAQKEKGRLDEALACFRKAVELRPSFVWAASNYVYNLHFHPDYDGPTILAEHRRWDAQFAAPLASAIRPHRNDPSPERRLRIGYVSPDYRLHPVGRFILPLLESHDHTQFEIFCYSSLSAPDTITGQCRSHADAWREIGSLTDEQVAEMIRQDQIDLLVDLTMHMSNNRMLVFARKPAPVQVTYLAYCGTTGLSTMDYRLTDPYLDPPGTDELPYTEESIHLAETYWCYQPVIDTPPVNALPALETGHVTFGCLNNFCKVSDATLEAWSRLLRERPESRLLLHAQSGSHRDRVRDFLSERGLEPDRVKFVAQMSLAEYLQIHGQIDVALDPFPYGGGTTTCDALWMGVPVVSLAGRTAVGRGGLSILSNLGLSDLVAHDPEQYVRICLELADDLPRLVELRASLRDRMRRSPLMDAPRFARAVEAAYRTMWQRWCARSGPPRPNSRPAGLN